MTLSVVINTKNSATYLRACLDSIKDIADEIVLVDMASTDKTLQVASRYRQLQVYQYPHPEVGYADPAREFAFSKATSDWIFMIDSDEAIKSNLAKLIRRVADGHLPASIQPADCYFIARRNYIFGQAIKHTGWYPDYQLRLWRRGQVKWRPTVHSVPKILGSVAYFPAKPVSLAIIHHNYQTVEQFVDRANKYTTFQAQARLKKHSSCPITPLLLWSSFWSEFWRRGFAQDGLLEGNHGLTLSLLQASSELIAQAKVWQAQGFPPDKLDRSDLLMLQREFMRESKYWWADLMVQQSTGLSRLYWRLRRKFCF